MTLGSGQIWSVRPNRPRQRYIVIGSIHTYGSDIIGERGGLIPFLGEGMSMYIPVSGADPGSKEGGGGGGGTVTRDGVT